MLYDIFLHALPIIGLVSLLVALLIVVSRLDS